jgi:hypothetical protein
MVPGRTTPTPATVQAHPIAADIIRHPTIPPVPVNLAGRATPLEATAAEVATEVAATGAAAAINDAGLASYADAIRVFRLILL